MLESFEFHHVGVAVSDIEKTAELYRRGGYRASAVTYDPVQQVDVCWLVRPGAPVVELLAPVGDDSPVRRTLDKNGVTPYHMCYRVQDLDAAVAALRAQRYVLVSRPAGAVALGGSRVCFLYHKDAGLVELAEAPANIPSTE